MNSARTATPLKNATATQSVSKKLNIICIGFDEKLRRKEQYNLQSHDSLKFNQELWKKEQKFDTVASYFGQGLFSDFA